MQENVKVFTREVLVKIFGEIKVKGDFSYKLRIDHINSRELAELAKLNEEYGMNFHVKRSGKGLIVYSPWISKLSDKPDSPKQVLKTVRDYYELVLNQDARIKAFDNTSKTKLDMEVYSLQEAIMRSFYISHTPEGAEYWQDVMIGEY